MLARMAGNILRTMIQQGTDLVFDALLPRASSAATATAPRSAAAKLPAQVQGAAARSTAKLPSVQAHGGAAGTTMAELQARKAKMFREELKDYKIYRQRRVLSEQAAERRNKVHATRVVVVGATAASVLAAAGIYSYKARGGHATRHAAPSV